MSKFYGIVTGRARTPGTRCGSETSGLRTECRTWKIGVNCYARVQDDVEYIDLYMTSGSGPGAGRFIGSVTLSDGAPTFTTPDAR